MGIGTLLLLCCTVCKKMFNTDSSNEMEVCGHETKFDVIRV